MTEVAMRATGREGRGAVRSREIPDRPVPGLRRRALTQADLTAQSVSITAPTLSMAAGPAIVSASIGHGAAASYLIATLVMLVVAACIRQFSGRMVAAGSLYSYVTQGLGPRWGFVAGLGLMLGYGVLPVSAGLVGAAYVGDLAARAGVIGDPGGSTVVAMALAILLVAVGLALCGVVISARISLAVEAVAVLATLTVLVTLLVSGSGAIDVSASLGFYGWGSTALGVALAMTSFVGFESAASLAIESRRSQVAVPRAVWWTAAGAGGLYTLASLVERGPLELDGHAMSMPLVDLATRAGVPGLVTALQIGIAASAFACLAGSVTALVRLVYSLAIEQVLPSFLAVSSRTRQVPYRALLVVAAVIALATLTVTLPGIGYQSMVSDAAALATLGYLLAYALVCWATPSFLTRLGERSWPPVLLAPLGAFALLAALVTMTVRPVLTGHPLVPAVFVLVLVLGVTWHARRTARRPELLDSAGVFDEAVPLDLFDPADFEAVLPR